MKNRSALILLLLANIISGFAQGISLISIPWYFAREGYLDIFIWFYIVTNILGLFWVPYSGVLVDKYSRKTIFMWTNLICGILLGGICWMGYNQGDLSIYPIAFVFIMTFLNHNIHYTNLYAFVQEITPTRLYGKITSILEVQGQATNILAGAFAVLLLEGSTHDGIIEILGYDIQIYRYLEAWKIHEIFTLDCLTYFVSLAIIASISYESLVARPKENSKLRDRLKVGFQFLKDHWITFIFGLASYIIFVTTMLEGFYLGAGYVKNHLEAGGEVYASSDIMYGLGAMISGFFIRKVFKKFSIPMAVIIMTACTCLLFFTLFATRSTQIFYFMLLIMGLTNAGTRIMRVTYLFNNIPNQVFGRAASVFKICNILIRILLLLLFTLPFFQIGNNIIYCFLILSVVLLGTTIVLIRNYTKFDLKLY